MIECVAADVLAFVFQRDERVLREHWSVVRVHSVHIAAADIPGRGPVVRFQHWECVIECGLWEVIKAEADDRSFRNGNRVPVQIFYELCLKFLVRVLRKVRQG